MLRARRRLWHGVGRGVWAAAGARGARGMKGEGAEGAQERAVYCSSRLERAVYGRPSKVQVARGTGKDMPKSRAAKAASSERLAMVNGTGCIAMCRVLERGEH